MAGRREDGVNDVLQQLQTITLDGARQPLGEAGLYFDLDSEYRYFYLDNRRRGQRIDLYPRIYRPLRLGHYLSIEPSVGLRETLWYADTDDTAGTARGKLLSREMADFRLDTSSELYRVYRPERWGIEALKHSIQPQMVYHYIPRVAQTKYPSYDGVDRLAEQQQVSAVLTQTFTTRSRPAPAGPAGRSAPAPPGRHTGTPDGTITGAPDANDADAPSATDTAVYREIGRIQVSESYDILAAREENPLERADANRRTPLTPVQVELEFSPTEALVLRADAAHSPYSGHYDTHNASVQASDPRGDSLFVEHRYTYNASESIYTQLLVPIGERLTGYVEWERNLHDLHHLETGVGLLYAAQCWALDVGYLQEYGGGNADRLHGPPLRPGRPWQSERYRPPDQKPF